MPRRTASPGCSYSRTDLANTVAAVVERPGKLCIAGKGGSRRHAASRCRGRTPHAIASPLSKSSPEAGSGMISSVTAEKVAFELPPLLAGS